ncbi:hypothetical protein F5Y01DRAFT_307352 [Xylaria sp. FL0043]|nr:hypothetical protein F5Y01DRAFT_307352 [Xylaria sp. FL0043]
MKPPRAVLQERGLIQLRDTTLPAICYDACNNANLEAQAVGKTPDLCSPDSVFMVYYQGCSDCIKDNASDQAASDYLTSTFSEWFDYCNSVSPTSVPPTSLEENTATITILYTTTIDGSETVWSLLKTLTTFAPRPDTAVVTIQTSQDGHPTIWTLTKTFTHLASDFFASSSSAPTSSTGSDMLTSTPHSSEVTVSPPVSTMGSESDQSAQSSRSWIAGPVVGGVAGIAILVLVTWWLLLRSKKNESHEVHGESALKSELEAKHQPQELDSHETSRSPVELEGHNSETRI